MNQVALALGTDEYPLVESLHDRFDPVRLLFHDVDDQFDAFFPEYPEKVRHVSD